MGRTVLVTGGSGFFGTVLLRRLHACGNQIRNLDIHASDEHPSDVEFFQGDIRDRRFVREACDGVDVVFHNVAMQPVARDPALFEAVNVGGSMNLLEAARDASVEKIVWTSTTAVYGVPDRMPVTEESPRVPVEPYGRTKLRGEELCEEATRSGLDITIVRPRTILGSGRLGIFSVLFDWIADGAPVFVLGRGDGLFQYIHAEDFAEACRLAAGRPGPASYNFGSAEFGTMRDTLSALVEHAGTGSSVRSLPMRPTAFAMSALGRLGLAPFAPYHWLVYGHPMWFSTDKARSELGWEPTHSDVSALIDSYEWFLSNRRSFTTEGRSHHQAPVRQGVLNAAKAASRLLLR